MYLIHDNKQLLQNHDNKNTLTAPLQNLIKASNFGGKICETAISFGTDESPSLLIVGVGKADKLNGTALQKNCQNHLHHIKQKPQIGDHLFG